MIISSSQMRRHEGMGFIPAIIAGVATIATTIISAVTGANQASADEAKAAEIKAFNTPTMVIDPVTGMPKLGPSPAQQQMLAQQQRLSSTQAKPFFDTETGKAVLGGGLAVGALLAVKLLTAPAKQPSMSRYRRRRK